MIHIIRLGKEQFNCLNAVELFALTDATCFGCLQLHGQLFKLAWNSELVSPIIKADSTHLFSIGVDTGFALFQVVDSIPNVLLRLELMEYFVDSFFHKGLLIIASQLNIQQWSLTTFQLVAECDLPDVVQELVLEETQIRILCQNEQEVIAPLSVV